MLVLSRKVSQQIVIGKAITLTILSLDGKRVRVGIDAPEEVSIRRAELTSFEEEGVPGESPTLPR